MANVAEWLKMDSEHLLDSIGAAGAKLTSGGSELVLDFSSVQKIDVAALAQMSDLATIAAERSARIGLRGVTVGVYRVLKTARIANKFVFLS